MAVSSSPSLLKGAISGPIVGMIEEVGVDHVSGWVLDTASPHELVTVALVVDGLIECEVRPHIYRPEIADYIKIARKALGPVGFRCDLPDRCKDGALHQLELRLCGATQPLAPPVRYRYPKRGRRLTPATASQTKTTDSLARFDQARLSACKPKVSAVILNRNGAHHLERLFESWDRYNSVDAELIVIDHASRDQSKAVAARWSHRLAIRWVARTTNRSFSKSSNDGANMARASHVLFLNNDIVLVQDILPQMLATLSEAGVAAVGVKLLKTTDHDISKADIQHLGVRVVLSGHRYWPYECTANRATTEERFAPQAVAAVTAACMLVDKKNFLKSGGFDCGYFYGYEDVDFCFRQTFGEGRKIISRNDLTALHAHGATRLTGKEPSVIARQINNQRVFARRYGLWARLAYWHGLVSGDRLLTSETLSIALAFSRPPDAAQNRVVQALSRTLLKAYPFAQIHWLNDADGNTNLSGFHAVLVCDPTFDLALAQGLRADARVIGLTDLITGPRGEISSAHRLLHRVGSQDISGLRHLLCARIRVAIFTERAHQAQIAQKMFSSAQALGLYAQVVGPGEAAPVSEIAVYITEKSNIKKARAHLDAEIQDSIYLAAASADITAQLIAAVSEIKRRVQRTFHTP